MSKRSCWNLLEFYQEVVQFCPYPMNLWYALLWGFLGFSLVSLDEIKMRKQIFLSSLSKTFRKILSNDVKM